MEDGTEYCTDDSTAGRKRQHENVNWKRTKMK